ncbi:TIGR04024 family LLM class F420-dependent oxidoreductase [Natranaeroarchaeum sulfidigenes]|uniref:Coenzyme F420-dependent N5,N10-methylene tetrahydromethanopterin reductase or related flavin-dependent oxidoreductase n=1 Tax=Natranaeroarchaeum sulfidigenes TaxID=2784880 RepID=A0A897MUL5_9EURY|nr:TIGR04024 family LLM class F420-dependent oxidoreductase [Natranaeroarchaeum sulfidigenes]QSG02733.1 Coenzyme F420-dependent N5,N10-methylene tetrahydromethanopterin reductase or related flavin-dependent oxidoreductase [Natranaeroarchaeum sulfidigenes]
MTDREIHLPVAAQSSIDGIAEITQHAESEGYVRAWMPETWGRDGVTTLTTLAERTDRIELGTSIANVFSRSPALLGQTAATLQEVSNGRFRLGIGPSGPAVIEGWHGESFDRPLRRTREYVEIIERVVAGEGLEYDGDIYSLSGFRLRFDPPETPPPIDVAGMGPKSVELAGRFADGWHATTFTPDGLRERLGDLRRGAELGDRSPDDIRVSLSLPCCVLEDGDRARELAAQHLAFYVGAMGTYYRKSLARQGYETEANEIAARWASGDQAAAIALIEDELLDELAVAGTPERAREQLQTFTEIKGLDAVALAFPRGASPADIDATVTAMATDN